MARNEVLALTWFLCLVRTQDTNVTAGEDNVCGWSIVGAKGLHISWYGNASGDSDVTVDAKKLSSDDRCKYDSVGAESKFSNGSIHLRNLCPNVQHQITIHFDCRTPEASRTVWTPPQPPQDITIGDLGSTSFSVLWIEPSGAGAIELYNTIAVTADAFNLSRNSTLPNAIFSGLQPYTLYYVQVAAKNTDFWGEYSDRKEVRTRAGIPAAPTNLRQTRVDNTSVSLTWDEPSLWEGPVLKYCVHWRNTTFSAEENTPSNATLYVVEYLIPYVHYTFSVSAVTEAGPGNKSEELRLRTSVGIPYAPENLYVTSVRNTSVSLKWEEPKISTGPILKYRVRWKNSTWEAEVDTLQDHHTAKQLAPYVCYAFTVLALTEAGPGQWSQELTLRTSVGIPLAPRNPKAISVSNTSVTLQWDEPLVWTGPILRYSMSWKNSSGTGVENTFSNSTFHAIERLTPFVPYTFRVSAETEAGVGEPSEELDIWTDVGVPHAPTVLTVTQTSNTSVDVEWKEPTVSTGPIIRYRVLWKNESGVGEQDTPSNSTFCQISRLTPYVNYTLRVLAVTVAGPGQWSKAIQVQTDVGIPRAPREMTVTKVTNSSADLTWDEPAVSTGPIEGYRVHWKNSSGEGEEDTGSATPSHTVKHLAPYVKYTFKVLALTAAGPGEWSGEVKRQTQVGVPHPPVHLRGQNITNTSVVMTWSEPETQTGPILSYALRWTSRRHNGSSRSSESRCLVGDLLPHLNYTFRVSAATEAGQGDWSDALLLQTHVGVPSAPRNLRCEEATNTSLFLTWNRPEFPNAPVLDYTLTYRLLFRDDDDSTHLTVRGVSSDRIPYVIRNLLPYTYYSTRVSASTRAGRGPASEELIAQTKVGVPLPAKILEVEVGKRRTAVVHWMTEGAYPGPVEYTLETRKSPGLCSDREERKKMKGSQRAEEWRRKQKTEVGDLSPSGEYSFRILLKTSATDDIGISSGVSERIRIAPEAPGEPLDIRAECTGSSTELKISWNPPEEPNGLITHYRIRYGIQRQNYSRVVGVQDMCQSQTYVLTGLRPERRYLVSVSARVENVSEDGKPAHPSSVCILPPGIPCLGDPSGLEAVGSGPESLRLEWRKDAFSDCMGAIVRYAVLVGRPKSLGNTTSGRSAAIVPPWFNFSSGVSNFYQATPPSWNPLDDNVFDPLDCQKSSEVQNRTVLRCTIGLEKNCPSNETYCNGPLEPDTQYEMKIRAFTGGGFTETDLIYARSRPVPKPSIAGPVVAVVVVLFALFGLGAGVYVMKKRGHLDTTTCMRVKTRDEDSVMQMEECASPKPTKTKDFAEHVRIMMSDSHLKFSLEFEKLKNESPQLPCTVAEMEENRPKNRWMNIFPFDHSRVKLLPLCDDPGSDFINANYIPGCSGRREYIATQGPLPHILDDFWRMVWEQSVSVIVMLTQCVERGKKKCEKYWPDSEETAHYGDLRITTLSVSMLSSYVIRRLHLQSGSYERFVKQMHFTHWPDFGCPESPEDLIHFVNAVRDHLPRVKPGPILVHCSAGVGRTGTFIAVDRLMVQLSRGEDTVDVYGMVLELRHHRTNMVQTEDQYIYIHLCVRQLIEDRDRLPSTGSQESIYSNVAVPRRVKPTAPELDEI